MTREEMQARLEVCRELYTDVRLLDADTVSSIHEGTRTDPSGPDICFACRNKSAFSRHCAAKLALATKSKACRLESCGTDIAHITARYYEVEGRPYVLELVQRTPGRTTIDPEDSEALMSEASGYGVKLYHDSLTCAFNRRYYEDVAQGFEGPFGVAIMDLDDFRIYNDSCGHQAGDLALEVTAAVIRDCIRQTDTLIRYGGDEFLLILPGCPIEKIRSKLEQIRARVQTTSVPSYPHIHLSLSIGGVLQTAEDTMETAVHCASRLMYQAKEHKNTVIVASSSAVLSAPATLLPKQSRQQILIADDSAMNRMLLAEILGTDFRILEASNGEDCLEQLRHNPGDVALVLLDINMPVLDGFDVLSAMNRDHSIEDIPVIMISSDDSKDIIRRAFERGVSDYINRPFDARTVYRRAFNTIRLYAKQRRLVRMVSAQTRKQEHNTTMLVNVLSQIVEFRNGESGSHVRHIRILTEKIMAQLLRKTDKYSLSSEEQDNITLASVLHDIGKIAIDEKILNKPGRLTPEEFAVLKTHTTEGAALLHRLENFDTEPLLQTACGIARWHHERWDGRGYPDGLAGDNIPIGAQLVSLADVYDALTSERCYKKAFPHEKAVQMILGGECGTFNPLLLECLKDIEGSLQAELKKDYHSDPAELEI